jgi:hypothetical protein
VLLLTIRSGGEHVGGSDASHQAKGAVHRERKRPCASREGRVEKRYLPRRRAAWTASRRRAASIPASART